MNLGIGAGSAESASPPARGSDGFVSVGLSDSGGVLAHEKILAFVVGRRQALIL